MGESISNQRTDVFAGIKKGPRHCATASGCPGRFARYWLCCDLFPVLRGIVTGSWQGSCGEICEVKSLQFLCLGCWALVTRYQDANGLGAMNVRPDAQVHGHQAGDVDQTHTIHWSFDLHFSAVESHVCR